MMSRDFWGDGWTCLGPSYWSGGWNQTSEGVGPGLKTKLRILAAKLVGIWRFCCKTTANKRESYPKKFMIWRLENHLDFHRNTTLLRAMLAVEMSFRFELSTMSSHLVFVESFKCRIWVNHRDVTCDLTAKDTLEDVFFNFRFLKRYYSRSIKLLLYRTTASRHIASSFCLFSSNTLGGFSGKVWNILYESFCNNGIMFNSHHGPTCIGKAIHNNILFPFISANPLQDFLWCRKNIWIWIPFWIHVWYI